MADLCETVKAVRIYLKKGEARAVQMEINEEI